MVCPRGERKGAGPHRISWRPLLARLGLRRGGFDQQSFAVLGQRWEPAKRGIRKDEFHEMGIDHR
jgi:hypothetical protein